MRYYINYVNKGGSNTGKVEVLAEKETIEIYDYKAEYKKNNVVPNEYGKVGIVLNCGNGEFHLSEYIEDKLGIESSELITFEHEIDRFNPALVKLIEDENKDGKLNEFNVAYCVKYIPFEYYQPTKLDYGSYYGEYFNIIEYDGNESIDLLEEKMNTIKLLEKIRDIVNSTESELDEKIQIIHDILNVPGDKFTISDIIEHSKYVANFGEKYFEAKSSFDANTGTI